MHPDDPPRPFTAIIAEDEALPAADLAAELEHLGVEVLARVRTPDEAFEAAVRHSPWLVVLDIFLDGGSGLETARRLHAYDGRRCVFVSGRLDAATRLEVNRLDPIAVLSKPLLGSQLLDVILHLRRVGPDVGGPRGGDAPPTAH